MEMANDHQHRHDEHGHEHGDHDHAHGGHSHHRFPDAREAQRMRPEQRAKERRSLLLTLGITLSIMFLEGIGGFLTGSLALKADAGHMLTDSSSLLLAALALSFAARPADLRRTYGFYRLEILAALANGVLLLFLSGWIVIEAIERFSNPQPIQAGTMMGIAAIGLVANAAGLVLLHRKGGSLNLRGAYLHVLGDTLSSVGVIVAAGVILLTGWTLVDPILSIAISLVIVWSAWQLVREAVDVLLEAVPAHIDLAEVLHSMEHTEGVTRVHDLHIWTISSGMHALSAHVVVDSCDIARSDQILRGLREMLMERWHLDHVTLQIETPAHCEGIELH